ncbi:hypothetical protein [Pseudorhodobacter aquimaris]|uniref:hypothetical protein n=1 Tax=Pseudorhodobacter aquimaris TaxID=687412 RepID=UPI00067B7216|nr:hypothetical protein [Pseudorhodobacter aquimaris]
MIGQGDFPAGRETPEMAFVKSSENVECEIYRSEPALDGLLDVVAKAMTPCAKRRAQGGGYRQRENRRHP